MPRIATKNFRLTLPGLSEPVAYQAGEVLAKEHEGHWYAQANSEEQRKVSKKQQAAIEAAEQQVAAAQAAAEKAVADSEAAPQDEELLQAAITAQDALAAARAELDKVSKE